MVNNTNNITVEKKRRSGLVDFFIRMLKEKPLGTIGGLITIILLLTGIFANFLAPYGYNEYSVGPRLLGPTAQFWMGTDNL